MEVIVPLHKNYTRFISTEKKRKDQNYTWQQILSAGTATRVLLQKQSSTATKLGLPAVPEFPFSPIALSLLLCCMMAMIKWRWIHECHAHIQYAYSFTYTHAHKRRKAIQAESKWMRAKVRQSDFLSLELSWFSVALR